jgi:hypothetical protein
VQVGLDELPDEVVQLAHVAAPFVFDNIQDERHRERRGQVLLGGLEQVWGLVAAQSEEVPEEANRVIGASTQGGNGDDLLGESVVEVSTEGAVFYGLVKLCIGRGKYSDVELPLSCGAHGLDAVGIEEAEQGELGGEREVADFFEEE